MKNNSRQIIIAGLLMLLVFIGVFVIFNFSKNNKNSDSLKGAMKDVIQGEANYSASFVIYTIGTKRDFSASMYHNLSPEVFIEVSNPNFVNVKKSGVTWRNFFSTLPFELDENCLVTGTGQTFCTNSEYSLQFYLNGELNQDALEEPINPDDKLLVTYDRPNLVNLNQQLQSIPDAK